MLQQNDKMLRFAKHLFIRLPSFINAIVNEHNCVFRLYLSHANKTAKKSRILQ